MEEAAKGSAGTVRWVHGGKRADELRNAKEAARTRTNAGVHAKAAGDYANGSQFD